MNEDEKPETLPPSAADPLLEKIKNVFLDKHLPQEEPGTVLNFMSTGEIWNTFHQLYPSLNFEAGHLAQWLHEKGFSFVKTGDNYEWKLFVI